MAPRRRHFEVRSAVDGFVLARESLGDGWQLIYDFASNGGALALRSIRVESESDMLPPRPPSSAMLRQRLRPADALAEARHVLAQHLTPDVLAAFHALDPQALSARPPRGPRRPDFFYAAVAAHCEAAAHAGSARYRVEAARRLGPGWDSRAVRDAMTAAKNRDLWIPGAQGTRSAGRLSDGALAVLRAGPPDDYDGPSVSRDTLTLLEAARTTEG